MTTDNFCFHLQNRLIQTIQTGGQKYSDTSPFSIPWSDLLELNHPLLEFSPQDGRKNFAEYQPTPANGPVVTPLFKKNIKILLRLFLFLLAP
jgi:hypothetical protein